MFNMNSKTLQCSLAECSTGYQCIATSVQVDGRLRAQRVSQSVVEPGVAPTMQ